MIAPNKSNPLPSVRQWWHSGVRMLAGLLLLTGATLAVAEENAIESISAQQQGNNVIVRVAMKNPVGKPPLGFAVSNPARIALDFADTVNSTGKTSQDIGLGDVRNVNVVQAGNRSRLVFNLKRTLNYATNIEGNLLLITIDGSGGVATAVDSSGVPIAQPAAASATAGKAGARVVAKQVLRDIDFRRGTNGEGRVVIDLPNNQIGVDIRQQGQKIVVDFLKTNLPDSLRRRLDVGDFGTPVQTVTTLPQGENVQMTIEPKGLWEHSAYQSDTQLVIEVKPIKEDPNKLVQGTQGYRGEKLTLNFQSIDVRSALQVLAEFSGYNIITSDTVGGTLTLRLKDVPWDQALDIVMQARGLDMRRNGSVLWIAPKDELLTKEKLELEQKSQIADLEPLKSEVFQLNYQKAESFKTVFGIDNAGGGDQKNRILSKRGGAVIDVRTNQLFVTDIASKLDDVRKLIQRVDVASRQVLIEARIVEADDEFGKSLGVKLGFNDLRGIRGGDAGYQVGRSNSRVFVSGNIDGATSGTLQSGFNFGASSQFFSFPATSVLGGTPASVGISLFSPAANRFLNLEISALEADQRGKVISSPRVITADKVSALIEQGTEIPYLEATSSGATSVKFRKASLKLEVTPQITPDGNIILDVDVNKDTVGIETRSGIAINTKHVKTQVLVENGGTVVLGGIYQQTESANANKVPFFGDLPVVGNLFKNQSKLTTKTELLIFITPKVVSDRLATR